MKTTWVLTEDDKNKVAGRRPPPAASITDQEEFSSPGLGDISIKTEAGDAEALGGLEHRLLPVKQRRPSSPMTPLTAQFKPSSQFFPGPGNASDSQIYSGMIVFKVIHMIIDCFRSFKTVPITLPRDVRPWV